MSQCHLSVSVVNYLRKRITTETQRIHKEPPIAVDCGPFDYVVDEPLVNSSAISLASNTFRSTSIMPRASTEIARLTDSS